MDAWTLNITSMIRQSSADDDGNESDAELEPARDSSLDNHPHEEALFAHHSDDRKVHTKEYAEGPNKMIEVIGTDDLLTEAVEEVGEDLDEGRHYVYEYDSMVHTQHDQNFIFQLYQPLETESGSLLCKICLELGETVEFESRAAYTHHRYKVHGSYNNNHVCPVLHCREIYASMTVLRKHLTIDHKLPLEMHFRTFSNILEFERFRHLVEVLSNCRFMMHTKQPHNRRQIMHCSRSEHKIILQSKKHKLPRVRMTKEGALCPAHISFRVDGKTGRVNAFYQLFHYGHAKDYQDINEDEAVAYSDPSPTRPVDVVFPEPPVHPADRPMQYVQMDLVSADSSVYINVIYSHILVITDIKTGFIFAKPIPETGAKQLLIRIVTDIFLQFGVPEGISCSHSVTLLREVVSAINNIFRVNIKEILYDTPDYDNFLQALYEQAAFELHSKHRWVEMVQFTTMVINQIGSKSAFERMFNRKPYNLPGQKIAPWLQGEDFIVSSDDDRIDVEHEETEDEQLEHSSSVTTCPPRLNVRDKVYLRNLDVTPGRGNVLPYLYGYIGATDWENSPHFPYRVHFSKSKDPWPSETSVSAWVSPYDVLPTSYDLMVTSEEDRQRLSTSMLCSCGGGEYGTPCPLYSSYLCPNSMSKACCLNGQKPCDYHMECEDNDDTYFRMEALVKSYAEGHARIKQLRRKIPSLNPENAPLFAINEDPPEMPVLNSESIPVVSTIVIENEERVFVPALGKRTTASRDGSKIDEDEHSYGRSKVGEAPSTVTDGRPSAKRPRRANDTESCAGGAAHESASSGLGEASKANVRKSGRGSKAKVYGDFMPSS